MCSNLIGYQNWWSHGHPKTLGQMNCGILVSCGNQYCTCTRSPFHGALTFSVRKKRFKNGRISANIKTNTTAAFPSSTTSTTESSILYILPEPRKPKQKKSHVAAFFGLSTQRDTRFLLTSRDEQDNSRQSRHTIPWKRSGRLKRPFCTRTF